MEDFKDAAWTAQLWSCGRMWVPRNETECLEQALREIVDYEGDSRLVIERIARDALADALPR